MKKLLVLLFFLFASSSLYAQSNQANITASANVARDITITKVSDLEIGEVFTDQEKIIAPGLAGSAQLNITSSNQNTPFTVPIQTNPLVSGTGAVLATTYNLQGSSVLNDATTLFTITTDTYSTGPGSGLGAGLKTLYLGATVNPLADQEGGNYEAAIVITVEII